MTLRWGDGKKMEKIEHKHNKTTKITWQSTYPLKVLVTKKDYGWINRKEKILGTDKFWL
jgi:hypothetical protein